MITGNVISRVLKICYKEFEGTGFTIDVEGREYLVTAKHNVQSILKNDKIEIFSNGDWFECKVTLVGHAPDNIDISVLAVPKLLTPHLPLEPSMDGLAYGQDVYFFGFPYEIISKFRFPEHGYPIPFVKKAIASSIDPYTVLLDGHNNPGFSGGPVVFNGIQKEFKVAAVISSFQANIGPVLKDNIETDLTYLYNTGIIIAHPISWAVDLINSNPIGHRLP